MWSICARAARLNIPVGRTGYLLLLLLALSGSSRSGLSQADSQTYGQASSTECADPVQANSPHCIQQSQPDQSQEPNRVAKSTEFRTRTAPLVPAASSLDDSLVRHSTTSNESTANPAEPPTEFQSFVQSTTGQSLPIYGASLFSRTPSTFAPVDLAPIPPDYVIGPGDELRIRVWGQVNFQVNLHVDRAGEIFLAQVGPVHVAGLPLADLNAHLRSAVERVYHNFDLSADLGQIRAIQVYVAGEARRPGMYTVSSLSTLVDTIFASGGPSTQGSMRQIQLRRGSETVVEFDLYNLLVNGDKSKDVKLESGDVIFFPPVGSQAAVIGSVRIPAIYELTNGESLRSFLAGAGGVSSIAAQARISIERIENHRERHAMEFAYDEAGLATPVSDADVIRVYSVVPMYAKTVILRGNTANPGRFAWHPGMHISDLIPDKESLITRNYWWKRARLGVPGPEEVDATPQPSSDGTQNLTAEQRSGGSTIATAQASASSARTPPAAQHTEIRELAPEIDWDYAVVERMQAETLSTAILPFDLGKLVLQHDPSQDLELLPGDVVSIFSQADFKVPVAHQTKEIRLDGEFAHAGVYTALPGETLRQLVSRAGGLTPNSYLYGSEFTRETVRAVQQARIDEYVQSVNMQIQRSNLQLAASSVGSAQGASAGSEARSNEQELLASLHQLRATGRLVLRFTAESQGLDAIPDIPLEDGDRFTVPPLPSSVNVVGAVYDQNSFVFVRGARAGTYLHYSGGPTRDADRSHEFIIRANGDVVSRVRYSVWYSDFDRMAINPGDTLVIPQKAIKGSAVRAFVGWSQLFSQFALGAAALSVVK